MTISIQVHDRRYGWSETSFTLYQVKNESQAMELAQDAAQQTGTVIRVAYPSDGVPLTLDYVSRLSGTYVYPKS